MLPFSSPHRIATPIASPEGGQYPKAFDRADHDGSGQGGDRSHRQIEVAGHQNDRHRSGHHGRQRGLIQHVGQVLDAQVVCLAKI